MPRRDVVVIGGSAGALQVLTTIIGQLPASLDACVLLVVHTRAQSDGVLPDILSRPSALPVAFARTHDAVEPGRIYVARPDFHLIATSAGLRLVHGPKENGFRPAVDPLFRTAAREFGSRVVGVILSGGLSDGTHGLGQIKARGGVAIVQDPDEAVIDSMPRAALESVAVDYVLRAGEIARAIERLTREAVGEEGSNMASKDPEPQLPSEETDVASMEERFGLPSSLTCPDCGGALWEIQDGRVTSYQCHVGHRYASDALENGMRDVVDGALWSAVRALEEQAELKRRLARRTAANGLAHVSEGFEEAARDAHGQAQTIRSVLFAAGNTATAGAPGRAKAVVTRRSPVRRNMARARGKKPR